jgi:fatty acid desaturase
VTSPQPERPSLFDLSFTTFITPTVVRVLYILLIAFGAVGWLFLVIGGFSSSVGTGIAAIILGGLWFVVLLFLWRVFLELTMVVFRINDNIEKMANEPR